MRLHRTASFLAVVAGVAVLAVFCRPRGSARAAEATVARGDSERIFHDRVVPFLSRNCYDCHGNGNHKGNLALDSFASAADIQAHPGQWQGLMKDLRGGVMPRSGSKVYPSFSERNAIADWIQKELLAYAVAHPDPGRAAIHRLTRVEYINTIRDLVGVEFKPGDDFPADETAKAIAPAGEARSLTPELREKYLSAAGRIMEQAIVANSDPSPTATTKLAAAREILGKFTRRAWRRPVEAAELDGLMSLFMTADRNGESFQDAIKQPMKTAMISPDFLFCGAVQPDVSEPKSAHPVREYELASRLSYFIWSSMPDDELFNLAEHHQLRAELMTQVKRMIASPKAEALVENFSGQWLQTKDLDSAKRDKNLFPEYDADLRASMRRETQLFFNAVMRKDRSVLDFVNGDYTFVNQRLAEFYGIPGIRGDRFQRVTLESTPRRGVLTQASVLIAANFWYSNRISIAARGKWVMMNLLDLPGSTPRIGAPPLPHIGEPGNGTLRKNLEQHRTEAACEYCHVQIDPLGFALENFDAIGKWRDKEGDDPVDSSGQLPTGESFNGAVQMLNILAEKHRDQFLGCIARKMLGYALGRGVEMTDQPSVDQIVEGMQKNDLKFSSLVMGIVNSMPFQMCRGETAPGAD